MKFIWAILLLIASCSSPQYREQYCYLKTDLSHFRPMQESDFFLVILVDARHLDYSSNQQFIKTVRKHPDDWSKSGDVGHAWIYLKGGDFSLEGGHSGELGVIQPKYFDGVMNYLDFGYSNPNEEQMKNPIHEPNPVKYLWESQRDGFFQVGPGRHTPTFAAKINISELQFHQIVAFIQNYNFSDYSITGNQCATFVTQIAAIAGLELDCRRTICIKPVLKINNECIVLWRDADYSCLTFATPDVLERSLYQAVECGQAEYALEWYRQLKRAQGSTGTGFRAQRSTGDSTQRSKGTQRIAKN